MARAGPIYHVKPHDSMDSLATRFHTHVDRLMDMNPDLVTPDLEVGQELCIIPDVCPLDM
jgi:LysM repeat protein